MGFSLPKNGRSKKGSFTMTTACTSASRDEKNGGEKKLNWSLRQIQEGYVWTYKL